MSEATMEQTNPPMSETPAQSPSLAEAPTYVQDTWAGLERFLCLAEGWQCWTEADMQQHMTTYHEGAMRAAHAGLGSEAAASASVDAAEEWAGQTAATATPDAESLPEAPATDEAG